MQKEIRILVVDQEREFFECLERGARELARDIEISCEYVRDGVEALERLISFQPTVVLLDAHLPERLHPGIVDLCSNGFPPVIFSCNDPSVEIEEDARNSGAVGLLWKCTETPGARDVLLQLAARNDPPFRVH